MRRMIGFAALSILLVGCAAATQDARPALEGAARSMGFSALKSIEFSGTGGTFAVGQSVVPGAAWPRFRRRRR